ncbi:MAG: nickel-dependent lactate racemase [Deltaproteobacteria bacterium]|nr:nickel-dependent lactate racemase [Deltaproteobacteria bacterium]
MAVLTMEVQLDYGRDRLTIGLPDQLRVTVLGPAKGHALADPLAIVEQALASPLGARPLAELASGRHDAVVVISDKTRPVPNGLILPPILRTLEAAGIAPNRIEILVATGLHRPNTREELVAMTSAEMVERYRFRNHVARNTEEHIHLGRTTRGTEIWLDRGYVAAGLKVVTGLIEPHLMAGYSGGRKGVAPGLAGIDTMRSAHGAQMLEGHVGPGIIAGNPFHADLLEIAHRVGIDFLFNVTLDRERQLTGVFAGDLERAHDAGVRFIEHEVCAELDRPADIVIASAGGFPLDDTYYQSIKGMVAALNIVRRGGSIILAAAITEGIGSADFRHLLRQAGSPEQFMARITARGYFSIDQWMVQHLCQVLRKAQVTLVSDGIGADVARGLLVDYAPSVEEALQRSLVRHGSGAHVAVLPQGPYVLATVRGRKLSLGRAWLDDAA